ncbi:MAG: hypothetical protein JNK75_11555 [Betaproteobacteria bacterium]|nr:hypothetical protein [Betaproteobacteria bacterium]
MLGKLGDLLNKDVGSIVKDAGKVLNADVGDIVKGAGKVLSTDVKDLVKDKPAATEDAQEAARRAAEAKAAAIAAAAGKAIASQAPSARPAPVAKPADALAGDKTMALPKFDPDATLQLNSPPLAGYAPPEPAAPAQAAPAPAAAEPPRSTSPLAPPPAAAVPGVAVNASAAVPILNDETTHRKRRPMPQGTSLAQLLPHEVGDFSRPQSMPSGEIASDTVSTNYGGGGETVVVRLALCWDADEAREPLERLVRDAGERVRIAPDRSWVLAETPQGVTFAWTREAYSYSATAAKGLGPLTRFLWAFPY